MTQFNPHGKWPDEDVRALLRYWKAGLSAGEIEKRMPWRSRSAICAKARRLRDEFGTEMVAARGTPRCFIKKPTA